MIAGAVGVCCSPTLLSWMLAPQGLLIADRYINAVLIMGWLTGLVITTALWRRERRRVDRARASGAAHTSEWRVGVIMGLFCFGILLTTVEVVLYATRKSLPGPVVTMDGTFGKDFGESSLAYGFRLRPLQSARSVKRVDGKLAYDVTYTTDQYGLRTTVQNDSINRSVFLLFFGASWVFGEGVDDAETLASNTAKWIPEARLYNFATAGYGPQHLLASLQDSARMAAVKERSGTLVYVIDDSAVERAIGSLYVYGSWGPNLPYYRSDRNGRPVRERNFTTGRPFTSLLYLALSRSQIVKRLRFNLPRISDQHIAFTASLVVEASREFKALFPAGQFRVLFYPDQTSRYRSRLLAYLDKGGVEILDYSAVIPYSPLPDNPYAIPGDGHPLPTTHAAVARRLAADLSKLKPAVSR